MDSPGKRAENTPPVASRHVALLASILAVLAAIAVVGPTLNRAETAAPVPSPGVPEALATSAPVLQPTQVPRPTPLPVPEPARAPTAPDTDASIAVIGDVMVAVDEHGVWTSVDPNRGWTMSAHQRLPAETECVTQVAGTLAFVHRNGENDGDNGREIDGFDTLAFFDPAAPAWLDANEVLPHVSDGNGSSTGAFCQGAVTSDGRLVLSAAGEDALVLAIQRLDGSFQRRTIAYPDSWPPRPAPDVIETRAMRHREAIVIAECSYYAATGCRTSYYLLHPAAIAVGGPVEMTWAEAGGRVILPAPTGVVEISADRGGSTDHGFELVQIGDEVWVVELVEEWGYLQAPDVSIPVGTWAASPLDTAPAPLGPGDPPRLSVEDTGVVATTARLGDPLPALAPDISDSPEAHADAAFGDRRRWLFDAAAHRWIRIETDPTEGRLPEQPYVKLGVAWIRTAPLEAGSPGD